MSQRNAWIALFALLGLMLAAACGGNGAGAAKSSAVATPTSAPLPPPPELPAFPGEPDYQGVRINKFADIQTALSEKDVRDLVRLSVRFATYMWTTGPEGLTERQQWLRAYPFATPQLRKLKGPPPASDADAKAQRGESPEGGPITLRWDPNRVPNQPFAAVDRDKRYPQDVAVALTAVEFADPRSTEAGVDGAVFLAFLRINGYWRVDTFYFRGSYGVGMAR